jgi:cation transport protein ChaC
MADMTGNPPPSDVVAPISPDRRARSLRETLARAPDPDTVHVFAYATLMWRPCFEAEARLPATLHGYRRELSIWSVFARGTPEAPGLGFALEEHAGGSCDGIVYRLPPGTSETDLEPLWEREMWTDGYRAEWVEVSVGDGTVPALTFVIRQDHPQYAGRLPVDVKAEYIASATGKYGPCRDCLAETVTELRALGFADPDLEEVLAAVDGLV